MRKVALPGSRDWCEVDQDGGWRSPPTGVTCDTGPANALIDAVVTELTGHAFDADGVMAARGQVHEELLAGSATRS